MRGESNRSKTCSAPGITHNSVFKHGKLRFSELKDRISNISERMLTLQLKKMEQEELVIKKVYAGVPVKVEYELSDIGKKLIPVLNQLEIWGKEHKAVKKITDHHD